MPGNALVNKRQWRTVTKTSKLAKGDTDEAEEDVIEDENILNKSQRREKAKKSKKEAKKQEKELPKEIIQEEETPQAAVLAELNEGLSAEETKCNTKIVKLGLLSVLAVFKDILPGLPTEKELEMKVSKAVKKTRFYESTLLKGLQRMHSYLQKLVAFEKQSVSI
ncbi:unnamed protein product [Brassica rapa]|uniref:Nucleolar complex-associated protein 3 N-terminal domain-containing protein n=1 Tax=Brassica campestris TaxID=3711 RepID=A0A3P6B578_BRACM|nr:unnamed protein product [Brassica rapa]VDD00133.1 unnamed protein product [Brassica rapa]